MAGFPYITNITWQLCKNPQQAEQQTFNRSCSVKIAPQRSAWAPTFFDKLQGPIVNVISVFKFVNNLHKYTI